jgi:hypothetical protein
MKWLTTRTAIPKHSKKVLIRLRDSVKLGNYNKKTGMFKLENGISLSAKTTVIDWAELTSLHKSEEAKETIATPLPT